MESPSVAPSDNGNFPLKGEVEQSEDHVMNGLSNGINSKSDGHHKHKHKDKDKDRHHDKHKHKDKEREKDRERHDNKEKSSSSEKKHDRRDKEHRDKDKERPKDKEHRNKEESRDKTKEKDYSEKNKENRDKEHKLKEPSSDKNKDSSHRSKDEKSSNKGESGSGSSKSHSSSSSSSKDRHHSSSSKDRHSSSSSDKHKDRHSSSSNKHSSVDKKSSGDRERSSSDKSKHKDRMDSDKKDSVKVKSEPLSESPSKKHDSMNDKVKLEPSEDYNGEKAQSVVKVKEEYSSQDEDSMNFQINTDSMTSAGASIKSEDSEDDIPLSKRASTSKRKIMASDDEDDIPLSARKKIKKETPAKKKKRHSSSDDEDSEPERKKKAKKTPKKEMKVERKTETASPTKKTKKNEEEEQPIWKWWEEEKKDDGVKWKFLEHKGPMFVPPYERLPKEVKFYYNGKEMRLSQDAEEVATFYSRLIEHEYTTKEQFNKNFFKDWRKTMTSSERETITDLSKCNFRPMYEYFNKKAEERKAMSKEEKKKIKEEAEAIAKEYGVCTIDGHKEKVGNFKIEPPGLFRGRGEHPKMGLLKKRVMPEDVIINCSKDSKKPVPPAGHRWKEVRHDNTVTWLCSWTENVQGQVKYVMLNPSSKLKGEKDWQKYETARKLAKCVDKIRKDYTADWKSKEMRIRQRAVAMYFIDKLALRAGNEKDEDQADTVGCCSLRVEHIQLFEEKDGKEYVVVFDFPGKDSIRYYNEVPVEKRVFKNLKLFCEKKKPSDDLFDRLNTTVLNKHLNELMEGLTAKVFRTYNASITLQDQLNELTDPNASIPEKILQYNRANRAVAILCNHQRSVPKSHEKSMGNLKQKIETKKEQVNEAQKQFKAAKRAAKDDGSAASRIALDKKKKALDRLKDQLMKLEVQETDKEENKTIALGTSKLNYLDPRISVAWCKKYDVPIEKVYNKTQKLKFRWAIDMAGPDFVF